MPGCCISNCSALLERAAARTKVTCMHAQDMTNRESSGTLDSRIDTRCAPREGIKSREFGIKRETVAGRTLWGEVHLND